MPELERDLGLYATLTISIGAMIGSGIFVLPGLATAIAGPAVVLAYLLAGVIVMPAALSKAEMATAMPESGGTYLYIDRAMGPLPGTIAGIGAWFSLVFKSAFALVGLGAYLLLFVSLPSGGVTLVALGLAVLLVVVNVVGVKQTGRLQATIVTLVLLSLLAFIADGLTYVDEPRFHPFFAMGGDGLLAATGFVFVSYAGVTKIASVAEEVEEPGRNIPIGILGSMVTMMVVYTLVVFVIVGVTPAGDLAKTLTPMAVAAGAFAGEFGTVAIAVVAVLALTSMANAGILSSTRYPLAMSRDSLAPVGFGEIHDRFRTPVQSILFSGLILVALVAFVPVEDLAKLASAFQILVFSLVNGALVAFRESDLDWYQPEFTAPGYPWVQLFGIVAGFALLGGMGLVPLVGAVGIIVVGLLWYRLYGREKTDREGAALDAIRRTTGEYSLDTIDRLLATGGDGGVLVAIGPDAALDADSTLMRVADAVAKRRGGRVTVTRFEEVPEQVSLSAAADDDRTRPVADGSTGAFDAPVRVDEVVTHDAEKAVANYVNRTGVNLVVGEWQPELFRGELLGEDVDHYMRDVRADFVFVRDRGLEAVDEIVVIADKGPYDPLEILVADALAGEYDARLRLVYPIAESASDEQIDAISEYHDRLVRHCSAPTDRLLLRTDDRERDLLKAAQTADLVVTSTSAHHLLYDVVFGSVPDALATELDVTVLLVHSDESRSQTFLRYLLERLAF